jgi:hypothetical protein
MPLTSTERQQRWRAKKKQAEIGAGLRPRRKPRRKTPTEIQRKYRARRKAEDEAKDKEAKFAKSRERRRLSREAPEVMPEFRLGDCREVLRDILRSSTALVLGDPPWDDKSVKELVPWFGEFAMRALVPGGSLLMFMGGDNYLEAADMLRASGLIYCRSLAMLHDRQHWFPRLNLRVGHRDVLWFMKPPALRRSFPVTLHGKELQVAPTVQSAIKGARDKECHLWSQGDAIWQWIEPLTAQGELIADPCCATGEWGWIAGGMGRRYVGSDKKDQGAAWLAPPP